MGTLREVKCGQQVQVTKLSGSGAVKRRIMDMGITRGTQIFVRKVAPLGDRLKSMYVDTSCLYVRQTLK